MSEKVRKENTNLFILFTMIASLVYKCKWTCENQNEVCYLFLPFLFSPGVM